MTRIHGQIESLKRIRETLDQEGIARFNSTGEINRFLQNYDNEIEELLFKTERDFDLELDALRTKACRLEDQYKSLKKDSENKLQERIASLNDKCAMLEKPARNATTELLNWYQLQFFRGLKFCLGKGFKDIVRLQANKSKKQLKTALGKGNSFSNNREQIISERSAQRFQELEHIKKVCDSLYPLIAGAIGEYLVAKELEKLSDDYVLINDFSWHIENPIYYKKANTRIYSIQIDHLLITHAGVFIIETKNWSKASIKRYDLRSPVRQIQRTNFALYILLNPTNQKSGHILKKHHWGHKEIPIKNIVAMIHHKPKVKFQYVAIKRLRELNTYIEHFEPIFDSSEVLIIADRLLKLKSQK